MSLISRPSRAQALLARIGKACKDAVFPRRCMKCGLFFHPVEAGGKPSPTSAGDMRFSAAWQPAGFEHIMAPFLCRHCISDVAEIASPICSVCGIPFMARYGDDHTCGACLTHPKHFHQARAWGVYDHSLAKIIQAFKYKGKLQLAEPLGVLLLKSFLRHYAERQIDLILPVPLHAKRLRRRGFNQSYLTVRHWRKLPQGRPWYFKITLDLLERKRWTAPQVHQSKQERRQNVRNAFEVHHPSQVSGRRVLLIDDVYTTGATVNECARILLKAGAESVAVLTVARAL